MNLSPMFSIINIIIVFLWVASAFIDYNDFCYIWQLKEYRVDRMRDFMSTQKGKDFWKKYAILWRSLLVIVVFFWPINNLLLIKYFIIGIFGFDLLRNIFQLVRSKIKHPVFTKKSILIIFASLLAEAVLIVLSRDWTVVLLLMCVRFFVISMVVFLLYLPTNIIKKIIINRAKIKLARYKDLIVVGITGSYGKTSVKNFLTTILQNKYNVIMTPRNINTEIGIAMFILQKNFNKKNVFVVEMGAYKVGEIKLICDMVIPSIGILTAISEQHLSLFGGIKMTQKAKYELLRSIPCDGLAIVNSDNKYCREYLDELECKVYLFGVEEVYQPDFLIEKIDNSSAGIIFSGKMHGEDIKINVPVVGIHNAKNIAPCYLVASYLGMSAGEISNQMKQVSLPSNVLNIIKYGNSVILDDSYNSNYHGFCAGLDVLNTYSDRQKIVITRGIPELGKASFEIHTKIGGEIAYVADDLIIIDNDNEEGLVSGFGKNPNINITTMVEPKEILAYIKRCKNKKCAILLENRVPSIITEEINRL
ncbi:MAG: Mur ligase family protein [bacterium]|nr:Mur ligase family protein [bacterium]